eukprot:scaffold1452_cov236-Pinguiococcus_pyrenoidosus.AAC.11
MILDTSDESVDRCRSAERVLRDANHLLDVRMIVQGDVARGHGPDDEDYWRVVGQRACEVVRVVQLSRARQAIDVRSRRQMPGHRVLDDPQQHVLAVRGADLQLVKQLHHQGGEALERPWNPRLRVHLDENVGGGLDVHLQLAGLVQRAVQKRHQLLMQDVRAVVSGVPIVLGCDASMVIGVEQLVVALLGAHSLQRRLVEHHDDSLRHAALVRSARSRSFRLCGRSCRRFYFLSLLRGRRLLFASVGNRLLGRRISILLRHDSLHAFGRNSKGQVPSDARPACTGRRNRSGTFEEQLHLGR